MAPKLSSVIVSRPLTDYSLGYENQSFIAEGVFPAKRVGSVTGFYWVYGREIFDPEDDRRPVGSRANEVTHDYSRKTYNAVEYALNEPVPWQVRNEARANGFPSEPYQDATDVVTEKLALGREIEVASTVRNAANYTAGHTVALAATAQWNDYANSDPLRNVSDGHNAIRSKIGRRGNAAIVPYAVREQVKFHPKILDKLATTGTKRVTDELLAELFEVETILVPEAIRNSANAGQTPSYVDIWGKDVVIFYRDPNAGRKSLNFGRIFRVVYGPGEQTAGVPEGRDARGATPMQVRRWTEEDRKTDFVEAEYTEARLVTSMDSGYLIQTATA
jgi:hypothetical protein